MHQINIGKLFAISTLHTNTLSVSDYTAQPITHKTDFFTYILCGKTNKNTLSKLSAQKMIHTLSSSVDSWRGKKYI